MEDVRLFLDKKDRTIPDKVLCKMNAESAKLNFEMAAKYRDYYRALSIISERQYVTETTGEMCIRDRICTICLQRPTLEICPC